MVKMIKQGQVEIVLNVLSIITFLIHSQKTLKPLVFLILFNPLTVLKGILLISWIKINVLLVLIKISKLSIQLVIKSAKSNTPAI
jgi:hypothetical protein